MMMVWVFEILLYWTHLNVEDVNVIDGRREEGQWDEPISRYPVFGAVEIVLVVGETVPNGDLAHRVLDGRVILQSYFQLHTKLWFIF